MWHSHPFTFKVARVETTYKYRGTMLFCSCFPHSPPPPPPGSFESQCFSRALEPFIRAEHALRTIQRFTPGETSRTMQKYLMHRYTDFSVYNCVQKMYHPSWLTTLLPRIFIRNARINVMTVLFRNFSSINLRFLYERNFCTRRYIRSYILFGFILNTNIRSKIYGNNSWIRWNRENQFKGQCFLCICY